MEKKTYCPVTDRELPASLAGYQLVCSSEHRAEHIEEDDILVPTVNHPKGLLSEWNYPASIIGSEIDASGVATGGNFRVYRKLQAPRPGDSEIVPGTTMTYAEQREKAPVHPHHSTIGCGERLDPHPLRFDAASGKVVDTLPAARTSLPHTAAERKGIPVATGFVDYFPDAMIEVARLSKVGNDQHNPGQPLHWDKSKSTDESDALMRHFLDRGTRDTDGVRHSAKVAWRAMALLQREIDAERGASK